MEISKKGTRASLAWINDENFILEELAIQQVARITHHGIEIANGITINITIAPRKQDSQEREFRPSLPAVSLEHRCGMMVRDMYLSLKSFGAQFNSKVRSCSKFGPMISKDC